MKKKLSILLLLINTIIFADNTNQEESLDDLSLEELMDIKVYSATKSYQRIEEIPANITIITRKEIEKFNYTTLDELFKHVPGLFIIDDTEHFQIGSRGSLGSSFQLMINNNPISPERIPRGGTSNRNFFATPIQSIDRIEIIKGPQAVTYGSNSMYGSINIITNDFNEKNIVSIGKGNDNQSLAFSRLNHKSENGGFTLNTSFYNTDGIGGDLKDAFTEDYYNSRDTNAVKTLDRLLGNKYKTLDFSHRYKNLTTDITYSQTNYGLYVEPSYRKNNVEQTERSIALTYEDEINDKLDYRINYINSLKNYDIDDFAVEYTNINGTTNHAVDKRNQVDLHFNYQFNEKIKLLLGTTYEDINHDYSGKYFNNINTKRNYSYNSKDLYSKIHYTFSEKFEFNAGVRYATKDSFNIDYYQDNDLSNPDYDLYINAYFPKKSEFLPEFSAIYHIDSNNHLKFLYGEANQLTYTSINQFENIKSTEINYIYLSNKYQINTSLFYNKSENIGLFTQNTATQALILNGNQITKGLEFSVIYKPNYNFQITPSITVQDSKNKFDNSSVTLEPGFSPRLLGKLDITYLYNKTRYSLLFDYVSKMKSAINNQTLERYGKDIEYTLNTSININHEIDKNLSLNFHVQNLFDQDNKIPAGTTLTDFYNGSFSKRRTTMLSLEYKF